MRTKTNTNTKKTQLTHGTSNLILATRTPVPMTRHETNRLITKRTSVWTRMNVCRWQSVDEELHSSNRIHTTKNRNTIIEGGRAHQSCCWLASSWPRDCSSADNTSKRMQQLWRLSRGGADETSRKPRKPVGSTLAPWVRTKVVNLFFLLWIKVFKKNVYCSYFI